MIPHPRPIESRDNPAFKHLIRVLSGRGIRKHGEALVAGPKLVAEFLGRWPERCRAWVNSARHPSPPAELPGHAAWYRIAGPLFREVDVVGTNSAMLLVSVPEIAPWSPEDGFEPGCTLLVPFQDPENVGAVIRSAAAFGASSVVLLEEAAHPYHPRALRASAGAVFGMTLRSGPPLADLPDDLPIVALSPEGERIDRFSFPDAFGLLPGIEGSGLPDRFRSRALAIPVEPAVESLNSAAATAIALYVWRASTS